uniref:Gypsy retrotransposon integrase-like protein 1 n=1 Tax=Sinocyclocheilus rhinocerous TaxID=307959 RepID=A0A673L0D0_9TELE
MSLWRGGRGSARSAAGERVGRRAVSKWAKHLCLVPVIAGRERDPEQHRQRFRSLDLGESGRLFVLAQRLRDSCRKWLLAEGSDVEHIIDRVVLEQFITRLPKKTAERGPLRSVPGEPSEIERLIPSGRDDFPLEQSQDESLKHAFEQVRYIDSQPLQPARPLSYPYFAIIKDRLYRVTQDAQTKEDTTQLLVPKSRWEMLFQAAHCNPMAGHLGQTTTLNRLMARFFWPGIHENVCRWCASCRECQLVNPPASPKAPLRPLLLMQVRFERIGMDLIGPLERIARGHRFALVLVDYATRYPEAVALRSISAKSVADALFQLIS